MNHERHTNDPEQRNHRWTGWIYFAGTMLLIGGTLSIIYGFIALFNDNWVVFRQHQRRPFWISPAGLAAT
jgi:hypothetical protein